MTDSQRIFLWEQDHLNRYQYDIKWETHVGNGDDKRSRVGCVDGLCDGNRGRELMSVLYLKGWWTGIFSARVNPTCRQDMSIKSTLISTSMHFYQQRLTFQWRREEYHCKLRNDGGGEKESKHSYSPRVNWNRAAALWPETSACWKIFCPCESAEKDALRRYMLVYARCFFCDVRKYIIVW